MRKNNTKKRVTTVTLDLAAEQERCAQQAEDVLYFLTLNECANASVPDFITDAVIDAIDEAGALVGFPTPIYAPEETEAERRKILANLFSQAPRIRLRDGEHKVQRTILELLHNPQTPADLYEAVAGFLCEESNKGPDLFHTPWGIKELVEGVPPEELRGHILAKHEKAKGGGSDA